jgi:hypothetical protein
VLSEALPYAKDNVLESWSERMNLGAETDALVMQLLYVQAKLYTTHNREIDNPYLNEILLKLRLLAYEADDVLDELDYFRIQDELDGTYHAANEHTGGCVQGLLVHARHTARAVAAKLKPSSSSRATMRPEDDEPDDSLQASYTSQNAQKRNAKFMHKLGSITCVRGVGKHPSPFCLPLVFDNEQSI